VANASVYTASSPQRLSLQVSANTDATLVADCGDVALVEVSVLDDSGVTHPLASHSITFSVSGNALLLGTGNGDPTCHTSDKSATRPAFHGKALAVVQAVKGGDVIVTATANGLQGDSLVIPQVEGSGDVPYWCEHWKLERL
jgi:beta-galactosidase